MARLNEPAAPPESLESIKRRFIRQNREFARVNSNQSVKIRSLESEVTDLINENRQLREQILSLHNELQKHRGSSSVFDQVSSFQKQLQERLQDLQSLVGGLEDLSKPRRRKRTTMDTSALLQIDRRSKIAAMEPEGLLSPIVEGKYYPRKTIECVGSMSKPDICFPADFVSTSELTPLPYEIAADDSPEIGPPPITIFDTDSVSRPVEALDEEHLAGLSSVNLEVRRRRRSSTAWMQENETEGTESQSARRLDIGQPMRANAKRKLDLTRDSTDSQVKPLRQDQAQQDKQESMSASANDDELPKALPVRKVLAPKPINNDPVVSPRKPAVGVKEKSVSKRSHERPERPKSRVSSTARIHVDNFHEEGEEILPTVEIKKEPKTPSAFDILSPASTEPSHNQSKGRATPPPTDLKIKRDGSSAMSGIEGETGAGRARRNRTNVSYAEPSLVSKMRRPGKEMVDAVSTSRAKSDSVEPQSLIGNAEETLSEQPHSPLKDKSSLGRPSSSIRRTKAVIANNEHAQDTNDTSAKGIAEFAQKGERSSKLEGLESALASMNLESSAGSDQSKLSIARPNISSRLNRRQTISDASLDTKRRPLSSTREARMNSKENGLSRNASVSEFQSGRESVASRRNSMML